VTVNPATEHVEGVAEVSDTVRPELAVAVTVSGASPKVRLGRAPKLMVWLALATVKVCDTCGAAM
jgi:hypothetical protein